MPRAFWSCNKSIESTGNQNIFSSDQPLTELIWMSEYLEKSLAPCLNEAIKQERCHPKGSHLLLWDLILHRRWQRAAAAEAEAAVAWNTKKHITSIHPLRYLTERLTMPLSLSLLSRRQDVAELRLHLRFWMGRCSVWQRGTILILTSWLPNK